MSSIAPPIEDEHLPLLSAKGDMLPLAHPIKGEHLPLPPPKGDMSSIAPPIEGDFLVDFRIFLIVIPRMSMTNNPEIK
jgi:hypothetical protein